MVPTDKSDKSASDNEFWLNDSHLITQPAHLMVSVGTHLIIQMTKVQRIMKLRPQPGAVSDGYTWCAVLLKSPTHMVKGYGSLYKVF